MKNQNNQQIINLHHKSALIQTDFSNQDAWEELVAIVKEGDGFNKPDLNYISNPKLNIDSDLSNVYNYIIDIDKCLLDIDYIFLQEKDQRVKCVHSYGYDYFIIKATDVWFVDWEMLSERVAFKDFLNFVNPNNVLELPLPITELKPIPLTQDFPYFGQGIAAGTKWAMIYILFKDNVNTKIKSSIPALLKKDITINGNLLTLQSAHFIAPKIEARYGTDKYADLNLCPGDEMSQTKECFQVSPKANQLFENNIEQWLLQTHQKTPILAAARGFDGWVEHVIPGNWQQDYTSFINIGEQFLEKEIKFSENHYYFMESSLYMLKARDSNINVSELFLDKLLPKTRAIIDVQNRVIKTQSLLLQNNKNYLKIYFKTLWSEIRRKNTKESIKKLADSYLKVEHLIDSLDEKTKRPILFYMNESPQLTVAILSKVTVENNKKLIQKFQQILKGYTLRMTSTKFALLSKEALSLLKQKNYKVAFSFYNLLIEKPYLYLAEKDTSVFNNLLWLLQKENTGWPINKTKNLKYINKALAYTKINPAIYGNAACLHVEMKEYEKAIDLLNSFFDNIKDKHERQTLLQQVLEDNFFKPIRDIISPNQLNKWKR